MSLVDILLVEDNPDHAILTMAVLEENNVEDGEEKLDFISKIGNIGLYWGLATSLPGT